VDDYDERLWQDSRQGVCRVKRIKNTAAGNAPPITASIACDPVDCQTGDPVRIGRSNRNLRSVFTSFRGIDKAPGVRYNVHNYIMRLSDSTLAPGRFERHIWYTQLNPMNDSTKTTCFWEMRPDSLIAGMLRRASHGFVMRGSQWKRMRSDSFHQLLHLCCVHHSTL